MCSHAGCSTDPQWQPVLVVPFRRKKQLVRVRFLELGYCQAHRESASVATFLSDEGAKKIDKFAREQGLGPINATSASLDWEELEADEVARLRTEAVTHDTNLGETLPTR